MTTPSKETVRRVAEPASRTAVAAGLGSLVVGAVAEHNGVDLDMTTAAGGAAVIGGVLGSAGESVRRFHAEGRGGVIRWIFSWLF